MNDFFIKNRRLERHESEAWLKKYLGDSLISLISLSKDGVWARVVVRMDEGNREVKISLPVMEVKNG